MKILFLRIGIDRGCGGMLSPIFQDGSFEYVPIPERRDVIPGQGLTYAEISARSGGTLGRFKSGNTLAHHDPEFSSFTYGEPNDPKRAQLKHMSSGDCLVFYAGFQGPNVVTGTCFVMGYFTVAHVHAILTDEPWPPSELGHLKNAHFRRRNPESGLVVVEGSRSNSKLLVKAAQLSDGDQRVLPAMTEIIGFGGSVKRATGRWVPEAHIHLTKTWLEQLA